MRALQADGNLGPVMAEPRGRLLADGSALVSGLDFAARVKSGTDVWRLTDAREWLGEADVVNAARTRMYRCSWSGMLRCIDVESGKALWEKQLPTCAWLRVIDGKEAGGEQLIAGAKNGALLKFDAAGKVLWQTRLRDLHEPPEKNYGAYVADALSRDVDSTADLFPVKRDRPGDYDSILRMGIEQIANGDFEIADAWQCESGAPKMDAPGHSLALPGADEGKALNLEAGQLVTQPLKRPVIPSATYLLEFMYRIEKPGGKVVAGVLLKGAKDTLTASKFEAKAGQWAFGRLAVKSFDGTSALEIGFEAEAGAVRVDKASLRAVRFPSANLLANSELQQIEPTFVKDIRIRYNRIPSTLRDKLMSRNHVTAYKQGQSTIAPAFTQEEAFLQNGRLDDVGQMWTYMPDNLGFSVTLTKPAHVSHIVLYFNNATPKNVYETVAIVANRLDEGDAEKEAAKALEKGPEKGKGKKPQKILGLPHLEALVRCNERRFVVVYFDKPMLTDSIKILPGKHPGRMECITEIEVYGPLGGGTGARTASTNPLDSPMFMANGTHVPTALPPDVTGEYSALRDFRGERPVFNAGVATFDGLFAFGDPGGAIHSIRMPSSDPRSPPPKPEKGKPAPQPERIEEGPGWGLASVTPTTTPAHYSGRIFVGSADAKLHAVADNGTYLWGFSAGGRIYSSPLPNGDDVYFGSDDGKLYKIDVDSGALIWEFSTGGKVRGSPALADGRVVFASGDGNVYAVSADSGVLAWKSPIAKFSRSSAALARGCVFIGDEAGGVHCLDAASGAEKWKQTLKGYVSHCPVVCDDGIFFTSEQGEAIFLGADGSVKWKRDLETRVSGQPIATQTQVLIPSERGLLVLRRNDGKPDERFVPPEKLAKCTGVQVNNARLFLTTAEATTDFRNPPRTYASYRGGPAVWAPKPGSEASK